MAAQLAIYKWFTVLLEWLYGFSAGDPCGNDEQEAAATDFVTLADCQLNAESPVGGLLSLSCKHHCPLLQKHVKQQRMFYAVIPFCSL